MDDLLKISSDLKKQADQLLEQTGVIKDLQGFGEVYIGGAYAGNVMWDPDIDIMVIRDTMYSSEEVLDILKTLYLKGAFRSYFIKGDWEDRRKGKEFPHGHYLGLKQRLNEKKWVVDIWFVDRKEFLSRKERYITIGDIKLTDVQREKILEFKQYRAKNDIAVSGQQIYEAVLQENVSTVEGLQSYVNQVL